MQPPPALPPMAVAITACAFAALCWGPPARAQPANQQPTPPTCVLLLNGEVLQGQIQRDGQRYKIELSEGGVAVLPRGDIWRVERSLRDLYDFRLQDAERRGGEAHFDLAKWCLKQKLYAEASVHLAIAERAQLDAQILRDLRARIEVAVSNRQDRATRQSVPVRRVSAAAPNSGSQASAEQPVHTTQLSPPALRQFSTRIQPLLINRCGNATCHGRASPTEFELTRPHRRGLYTPRLTQRNAVSTAQHVNFAAPSASGVLEWSARPHGGMTSAALNADQLETLRQWLAMVTGRSLSAKAAIPASADAPSSGGLVNPLHGESTLAADPTVRSDVPASDAKGEAAQPTEDAADPFDPELFNRQHQRPNGER